MIKKIKKIGIIIALSLATIGAAILIVISAGKNKTIKKLLSSLTDSWKKNVTKLELENEELDKAYANLTEREKGIIEAIKSEPSLVPPDTINPTDYKAMIKWFDALGEQYE